MGDNILKVFMVGYSLVALVYLFEGDSARALYFISALGISLAVLWMK